MKTLDRRLRQLEGVIGPAALPEPLFVEIVDSSVPDPDIDAHPFPYAPDLITAFAAWSFDGGTVIARQPGEELPALRARCQAQMPTVALWWPLH
ncbi:MAG: hypothetical protein Q8Q82_13785 [Hydrogenophaga sp.]|nr:hypothetical protein [Hydrogenophaga sp.]